MGSRFSKARAILRGAEWGWGLVPPVTYRDVCPQIHFASKFNRRSGVRRFSLPITPARREGRRASIVSVASSTCKVPLCVLTRLTLSLFSHPPRTAPMGRLQSCFVSPLLSV